MTTVVKYGGNAMTDAAVRREVASVLRDFAASEGRPVVVHGGGPAIQAALDREGIRSEFRRGLRVTPPEALPPLEAALTLLGKALAAEIGPAVGLTGRDAALLVADVAAPGLGRVGRMREVRAAILEVLLDAGLVPVVACLALDDDGAPLNVNADEVASAVAAALQAPVVFLTNVPGVLDRADDPASVISSLTRAGVAKRVADGRIAGGMIPKVEAALHALDRGASYAVIADGRSAEAVEAALHGRVGTRITAR